MVKKFLVHIFYKHLWSSALSQRLRRSLLNEQLTELRPFKSESAISDLFIWRIDSEWDTTFQIFNISSFLFPKERPFEQCELIIFDMIGKKLSSFNIELKPFEMRTLDLSTFIKIQGIGTFAVFHYSSVLKKIALKKSHLTERGYIAYSRKKDALKSFCHGNLQSLAKTPKQPFRSVVGLTRQCTYYPQLILSDSDEIELLYTNPSSHHQAIVLEFYNIEGEIVNTMKGSVSAFGCERFKICNKDRAIHTFKSSGKIVMWRPIIFKHHASHFDVLHA